MYEGRELDEYVVRKFRDMGEECGDCEYEVWMVKRED